MKTTRCFIFFLMLLFLSTCDLIAQSNNVWNKKNASKWFKKQEWLNNQDASSTNVKYDQFGRTIEADANATKHPPLARQQLKPHESIDKVEFAKQYHAHKLWWDKAFVYLRNTDLAGLTPGDHPIIGNDVFVRVTEAPLKNLDSTKWEAHKNYADVHYVVKGREKIGIGSLSTATLVVPYNSTRDISFYNGKGKYYVLTPGTFFIAFPHQIHKPSLEVDGKETEKKVVIKIRTDTH